MPSLTEFAKNLPSDFTVFFDALGLVLSLLGLESLPRPIIEKIMRYGPKWQVTLNRTQFDA